MAIPAVVMTSHEPAAMPKNVPTARGDPSAPLEGLKAMVRYGDIWLLGGGVLAGQLLDAGLIDRVEMTVLPISLGQGRPQFGNGGRRRVFDRVGTRTHGGSTTMILAPRKGAPAG